MQVGVDQGSAFIGYLWISESMLWIPAVHPWIYLYMDLEIGCKHVDRAQVGRPLADNGMGRALCRFPRL